MILHYIGRFKFPRIITQTHLRYFNHYQTLCLQPNATQQEIKVKFKQLAKRFHPDNNPNLDKNSQFIKIKQAYDCLKDYNLRKQYDRSVFPQREQEQVKNFYYYRTEQSVFHREESYKRQAQKKFKLLVSHTLNVVIFGFIFYYIFAHTLIKTEHEIRRENIILKGQNIDSGPSAIERRKKQYAGEMKQKKIYGKIVQLNIKGGYVESTRAKTVRKSGLSSIQGVKKYNQDIIDFNEKVEFM